MVYGYYTRTIGKKTIDGKLFPCPKCEANTNQALNVICKVNHLMFIPFYPTNKEVIRKCNICEAAYYISVDTPLYKEANVLKANTRQKWYYYSCCLLILLFLCLIGITIISDKLTEKEKLADLHNHLYKGYTILEKLDDGKYSTMIIVNIVNDSIFVRENTKASDKKGANYIDEIENYSLLVKVLTKDQIVELVKQGKILDAYLTTTAFQILSKEEIKEEFGIDYTDDEPLD